MSNIDYLIPDLQMMYGDIDGTTFSEDTYDRSLIAGARMLTRVLANKYRVLDGEVYRNTDSYTFETETPYIESEDEMFFLLAALTILYLIPITGSNAFVGTWSTPDLSISTVQGNKSQIDLYNAAVKNFQIYVQSKLGRSVKAFLPIRC